MMIIISHGEDKFERVGDVMKKPVASIGRDRNGTRHLLITQSQYAFTGVCLMLNYVDFSAD